MARSKKKVVEEEVPEVAEEATPEATEQAEAVADAAKVVAEAKAALDEAQAVHKQAVDDLAAANQPLPPEYGVHVLLEGQGRMDMPTDWHGVYEFRLRHNGGIYDHVSDDPATGVWVYRKT